MKPRVRLQDVRVGFLISHPFHFMIYQPLIRALDNPLLVIEKREKTPFEFSTQFLADLDAQYVVIGEDELDLVDLQLDVVFVMTPKHLQGNFSRARTVVTQYGMAKEFYNYGLWRCLGDLNLMYGPYSHKMIEGHAVSRPVGNLRLDGYVPKRRGGGGLLYLPTYGELSTLGRFIDLLPKLHPDVPITVKLHHASEFADAEIIERLHAYEKVTVLDGYRDAFDDISEADVVLSDYSGAIFDAIFLERPVALFQPGYSQSVKRTDDRSIEISQAERLGTVLRSDEELVAFFDKLAEGGTPEAQDVSRSEFLSNQGEAVPVVLDLLEKLVNDEIERSLVQESIQTTYETQLQRLRTAKAPQIGVRQAVKNAIERRPALQRIFGPFAKAVRLFKATVSAGSASLKLPARR